MINDLLMNKQTLTTIVKENIHFLCVSKHESKSLLTG